MQFLCMFHQALFYIVRELLAINPTGCFDTLTFNKSLRWLHHPVEFHETITSILLVCEFNLSGKTITDTIDRLNQVRTGTCLG